MPRTVADNLIDSPCNCIICGRQPEEIFRAALGYAFMCKGQGPSGTHQTETYFNDDRNKSVGEWNALNRAGIFGTRTNNY